MTEFHIMHFIPDRRLHIFNGYNEVIESLVWGLRSLGHNVTCEVNRHRAGAVQIVFGAQMMNQAMLDLLPDSTIIYNLEQLEGLAACGRQLDEFKYMTTRFTIWDYSFNNLLIWREMSTTSRLHHVPIGFAPCLNRIRKPAEQDIDVLLYGAPSDRRFAVFTDLCKLGLTAIYVYGLYGSARDELVGRSKVVANVTAWAHSSIFSIVRASYLLANRKAVVADFASVESDLVTAVHFAPLGEIPRICNHYVHNKVDRTNLEERGFEIIERRDIRAILRSALTD